MADDLPRRKGLAHRARPGDEIVMLVDGTREIVVVVDTARQNEARLRIIAPRDVEIKIPQR